MKYTYMDKGQAYLVSDEDKREIEKALMGSSPVNTHGRVIYVIPDDPDEDDIRKGKTRCPAAIIRDGALPSVRWYWGVKEHRATDRGCKTFGDGLCGFKMVRYFGWNSETKKWELLPMVNHATPEQEKVLDAN